MNRQKEEKEKKKKRRRERESKKVREKESASHLAAVMSRKKALGIIRMFFFLDTTAARLQLRTFCKHLKLLIAYTN